MFNEFYETKFLGDVKLSSGKNGWRYSWKGNNPENTFIYKIEQDSIDPEIWNSNWIMYTFEDQKENNRYYSETIDWEEISDLNLFYGTIKSSLLDFIDRNLDHSKITYEPSLHEEENGLYLKMIEEIIQERPALSYHIDNHLVYISK